jgi:acetate kinase
MVSCAAIANRPAGCLPANLPHIRVFDAAFFAEIPQAASTAWLKGRLPALQ